MLVAGIYFKIKNDFYDDEDYENQYMEEDVMYRYFLVLMSETT